MKAKARNGWRSGLLISIPLALIVALLLAFSGPLGGAASAQYDEYGGGGASGCANWDQSKFPPISSPWGPQYWAPPTPCDAGIWGVNGDKQDVPFDGYVRADELYNPMGTGLLQDSANKGKVHIIDVRTPSEDTSGLAP